MLLLRLSIIFDDDLQNRLVVHFRDLVDDGAIVKGENFDTLSVAASDEKERSIFSMVNHQLAGVLLDLLVVFDVKLVLMDLLSCRQVPY